MRILFLVTWIKIISVLCLLNYPTNAIREISHEDIRDAILSLVHMYRDNTDKLERHESRERQQGEQFKKLFANIEKKQKSEEITVTSVVSTLLNISDRIQQIENYILQEKSKPKESERQSESFEKVLSKIDGVQQAMLERTAKADVQTNVLDQVRSLQDGITRLQTEMVAIQDKMKQKAELTTERVRTTTTAPDDLVARATEIKLNEIQETLKTLQEQQLKSSQDQRENHTVLVKSGFSELTEQISRLAEKDETNAIANATVEQIERIKFDMLAQTDATVLRLEDNMLKIRDSLTKREEALQVALTEISANGVKWYNNIENSYLQLLKEITALSKVEQVLVQTADNVLDTKKRIEYGTHHILVEVNDLMKQLAKETNAEIRKEIGEAKAIILDSQGKTLTNLTSKVEVEISQVWRQINVMSQTLTATSSNMEHLETLTNMFVNGSLDTMNGMKNKVGEIRSGMLEMDDNLNYLLGRLSLVTQEFNQIKIGLGEALEQVKANFRAVKNKPDDPGPGPNYIDDTNTTTLPFLIDDRHLAKTQYDIDHTRK